MTGRILVVDDDPSAAQYLSVALEEAKYETEVAGSGSEALRALERLRPALVITDLCMPGMSGLEVLAASRARWPEIPVMLVTVEEDVATVVEAVQRGAVNYLVKPVSPSVLLSATAKALARRSTQAESRGKDTTHTIVGQSAAMVRVRQMLALASRSDVNVVVAGETGTGKELVARAVHQLGGEPGRPFVAHNCALTPSDMFDSEFFGHSRGAFTGAHRERPGLLRDAHGGSLFLDELECLSLANQAKLLRVIDDGEVRPLGSERAMRVSVRFVAATNRTPEAMLAAGELREDLYYRLRGFEIRLPALRERLEDIPLLASHFLAGSRKVLAPQAAKVLQRCSWPGNIRQLRMVLQCAVTKAGDEVIDVADFDLEIPGGLGTGSAQPPPPWAQRGPPTESVHLESIESQAIRRALAMHGGNRSRAARALGIHRSTLLRRLRELGLEREDK